MLVKVVVENGELTKAVGCFLDEGDLVIDKKTKRNIVYAGFMDRDKLIEDLDIKNVKYWDDRDVFFIKDFNRLSECEVKQALKDIERLLKEIEKEERVDYTAEIIL